MTKVPLNCILLFILLLLSFPPSSFGQTSLVKSIYFKNNSSGIDKRYLKSLNVIASKLSSDTFGFLKVFGFADRKGSEYYNELISEKRALAVYNYLASHSKFDTTAVYVTWIGESEEAYDLHFPEAHIQQRCVDIYIQFRRKEKLAKSQ